MSTLLLLETFWTGVIIAKLAVDQNQKFTKYDLEDIPILDASLFCNLMWQQFENRTEKFMKGQIKFTHWWKIMNDLAIW